LEAISQHYCGLKNIENQFFNIGKLKINIGKRVSEAGGGRQNHPATGQKLTGRRENFAARSFDGECRGVMMEIMAVSVSALI
jgi:hypothetical protein